MCLHVHKSLNVNGNFRDFSKRGPVICHLQNGNSRWPCSESHPKFDICLWFWNHVTGGPLLFEIRRPSKYSELLFIAFRQWAIVSWPGAKSLECEFLKYSKRNR